MIFLDVFRLSNFSLITNANGLKPSRASYCAFHKHANSEVQKPTDDCVFRCRQ